jgi:hypothetical protein
MPSKSLEIQFADILNQKLKELPKHIATFFDIAGFPKRETVLSNFLAYFLTPQNPHGFDNLFINSLNEIIFKETGKTTIQNTSNCSVSTEVKTKNGLFIDILILEVENNNPKNAIIIENKIDAPLYNNLKDYYNHPDVSANKAGIVLSRKPIRNLPEGFINITHQEFINHIEQLAGPILLNADIRHYLFLKELFQNIRNMSQNELDQEHYDFYFKNLAQITKLARLENEIKQSCFRSTENAMGLLDMGLWLSGRNYNTLRYYFSSKAPDVMFTILVDQLFNNPPNLCIIVELGKNGIKQLEKVNAISFTNEEQSILKETSHVRKPQFIHYAEVNHRPSMEDMTKLTECIVNQITQTPLKSIFLKIENQLTPQP